MCISLSSPVFAPDSGIYCCLVEFTLEPSKDTQTSLLLPPAPEQSVDIDRTLLHSRFFPNALSMSCIVQILLINKERWFTPRRTALVDA